MVTTFTKTSKTVADPGFPVGGVNPLGAWTPDAGLFSENVCKNEKIASRRGGVHRKCLYVDPPLKQAIEFYVVPVIIALSINK